LTSNVLKLFKRSGDPKWKGVRIVQHSCYRIYAVGLLSIRFGKLTTGGRAVLDFLFVCGFSARSAEKPHTKMIVFTLLPNFLRHS